MYVASTGPAVKLPPSNATGPSSKPVSVIDSGAYNARSPCRSLMFQVR